MSTRARLLARIRLGFVLTGLPLTLPACTLANYGTLLSRRTTTHGAEIVEVFALGAQLRPLGFDTGLSLGYRHAAYIFPLAVANNDRPRTEWAWFRVPALAGAPLLRASTSLGLETQFTPGIKRCTLGYLDQILTDGGGPGESRIVKLHYERRDPLKTRLEFSIQ